jgi:hypothetical protein
MFSLIITIVSIALVVALVAATMYHGGDTLTQGRTTADAAAFVSGAQQVAGGATMFLSLEGAAPADVAALVTKKYIASVPNTKSVAPLALGKNIALTNIVSAAANDAAVCQQLNKNVGLTAAKTAAAADTDAALVVVEADFANLPYGCVSTGNVFQFKY